MYTVGMHIHSRSLDWTTGTIHACALCTNLSSDVECLLSIKLAASAPNYGVLYSHILETVCCTLHVHVHIKSMHDSVLTQQMKCTTHNIVLCMNT